jgi:hypothetical protein
VWEALELLRNLFHDLEQSLASVRAGALALADACAL